MNPADDDVQVGARVRDLEDALLLVERALRAGELLDARGVEFRGSREENDGRKGVEHDRYLREVRSKRGDGEVVEVDDRIRLGPDAYLPGVREGLVVLVEHLLAVEEHGEVVAPGLDGELVP